MDEGAEVSAGLSCVVGGLQEGAPGGAVGAKAVSVDAELGDGGESGEGAVESDVGEDAAHDGGGVRGRGVEESEGGVEDAELVVLGVDGVTDASVPGVDLGWGGGSLAVVRVVAESEVGELDGVWLAGCGAVDGDAELELGGGLWVEEVAASAASRCSAGPAASAATDATSGTADLTRAPAWTRTSSASSDR